VDASCRERAPSLQEHNRRQIREAGVPSAPYVDAANIVATGGTACGYARNVRIRAVGPDECKVKLVSVSFCLGNVLKDSLAR
jgi:hypothetical protein